MLTEEQFKNLKVGDLIAYNNTFTAPRVGKIISTYGNYIGIVWNGWGRSEPDGRNDSEGARSELFMVCKVPMSYEEYRSLKCGEYFYDSSVRKVLQVVDPPHLCCNMGATYKGGIYDYTLNDDIDFKIHSAFNLTINKPVKLFKII